MSIILLEHPRPRTPNKYESVVNTPLSSCLMTGYVASTLKSNNHDVDIVDANLYGWSFNETIQELKKRNFKLLGVHLVYLWENTEDVFEMLLSLRKSIPDAHINLYGHLPTFASRELLANYPFVDSVTIGEPETTLLELSDTVINNKDTSALYTINGLALNSINCKIKEDVLKLNVILNKPRKPVSNLDNLPFPYRNDFELTRKRGISTYILASRGCYGKCTFCYLDNFYGEESSWRGRSPENVFNEIYDIYENLEEEYFYFADANFFGPGKKGRERACELANLIMDKGLNIKFGIECRVDDIEDKTVGILVNAGLKDVFLGIESGSQRSLDKFRKFTKVEDNKMAINILRRYGIEPNYGFIMFEPDSTLADVRANFEFLKEMKMLNSPSITAHLLHHKQTVFKGTFDYQRKNNGAKPVSKIMYESAYEFKDKAVEALSENINAFCLRMLKDLSLNRNFKSEERDSCVYDENDTFSKQMNEKLVEHFEQTLSSIE
ncbi:MAG: B12-binding domain-containing radical SAM protein [Candidatus Scalindua sp.]